MKDVNTPISEKLKQSPIKKVVGGIVGIGKELQELGRKASENLDFAVMGVVSDRVFETLGLPERDNSKIRESYLYDKDAYFDFLQDEGEIERKSLLCDLFAKTKTFRGRKYLFEEFLSQDIPEYEVFQSVTYSTIYDAVFLYIFQDSDLYLSEFFDRVSHSCYNTHEVCLFLDVLYQKLGSDDIGESDNILGSVERIIRKSRKGNTALLKSECHHISQTISLLKIKGEPVTFENILSHSGLYTKIPSILSSTHGENSISIGIVKGFARSHRPKTMKNWGKHARFLEALLTDGMNFEGVRKNYKKAKMWIFSLKN